jgi:hypothetical protein
LHSSKLQDPDARFYLDADFAQAYPRFLWITSLLFVFSSDGASKGSFAACAERHPRAAMNGKQRAV